MASGIRGLSPIILHIIPGKRGLSPITVTITVLFQENVVCPLLPLTVLFQENVVCPLLPSLLPAFCNTRIAQLAQTKSKLGDNFEIVAIFESKIDHLKKHANKHTAKFPILADYERKYYEMFGVKKSLLGMLRGILIRALPAIKGMFSGYLPREISSRFLTLPLSLLIDEQGVIQNIYHGKDGGDHMPLEQIMKFAKGQV